MRLFLVILCACEATGPVTRGRVDAVTPGDDCPRGGLAIHTGVDDDDDKQLDDDEIGATTYECRVDNDLRCEGDTAHRGSVTIASPDDEQAIDGVTCIEGDLIVANHDAFEVLGLARLHTITGHVVLAGNPNLATLDGLDRIRTVGGTYVIQGNQALVELGPVAGLVEGDLSIIANDYLPDLAGLESMTKAPGAILIAGNPEMTSLYGFGIVDSDHPITIRSNAMLDSLEHLASLRSTRALTISDNSALAGVVLPALSTVAQQLTITHQPDLRTIALPSLASAQVVKVASNASLVDLRLPALQATNGLLAVKNPRLTTLHAGRLASPQRIELVDVPALRTVDFTLLRALGTLTLRNAGLVELTAFGGLSVAHDVEIESCGSLRDLGGLASLTSLGGSLTVANNGALAQLGLDSLAEIGGDFSIHVHSDELREEARALTRRIQIRGRTTIE